MLNNKIKKVLSFNTKIHYNDLFEGAIDENDITEVNQLCLQQHDHYIDKASSFLKENLKTVNNNDLLLQNAFLLFNSFQQKTPLIHHLTRILKVLIGIDKQTDEFLSDLLLGVYTNSEYDYTKFYTLGNAIPIILTRYPQRTHEVINYYHSIQEDQQRNKVLRVLVSVPNLLKEYEALIEKEALDALYSKDEETHSIGIYYLSTLHPEKADLICKGISLLKNYKAYNDTYNNYGLKLSTVKQIAESDLKTLMSFVTSLPIAEYEKDPYLHHNCGPKLEAMIDKFLIKKTAWDADDWKYVEKRGYYRFLLPSLYIRYNENPKSVVKILKKILNASQHYEIHADQLGTAKDIIAFLIAKHEIDKQVANFIFDKLLTNSGMLTSDIQFYLMALNQYKGIASCISELADLIDKYHRSELHTVLFTQLIENATQKKPVLRTTLIRQIK